MLKIGCHTSASAGFVQTMEKIKVINGDTFQFFTRPPRGGNAKPINEKDCEEYNKICKEQGFGPITAHAPYTLNPCAADVKVAEYAETVFKEDLERMEYIPGNYYNFHPGCHVGQGADIGIEKTAALLNRLLTKDMKTTVLIETMAGKGSEIGRTFEEIKAIIDRVELEEKVGVCFDTCHTFDGGYDIVNDLDGIIKHFDEVIGLKKLKFIHLNDSMNTLGSRKDRHSKIGEGGLGLDAITRIICHPLLANIPFCLETPNELEGYAREIALLKKQYELFA